MRTIRLVIHGDVHGVGYRWHVAQAATRHGVTGFVRNADDGSVQVAAQHANKQKLVAFLEEAKRGPAHAHVDHVEESETDDEEFLSFERRY